MRDARVHPATWDDDDDDATFWALTPTQRVYHVARLRDYYARQIAREEGCLARLGLARAVIALLLAVNFIFIVALLEVK